MSPETVSTSGRWPVPHNWRWVHAREIARIVGGGTPPSRDENNFCEPGAGIPWITPADLTGYASEYIEHGRRNLTEDGLANCGAQLIPTGSVLLSSRAPIGYCVIAKNPLATSQGFKSLVLPDDVLPSYVRAYLKHSKDYLHSLASGTTFPEISGRKVGAIEIPLPPLAEQRRIVARLEALMARSRQARTLLEEVPTQLAQTRQSLLASAFRGDLTADWRAEHKTSTPIDTTIGSVRIEASRTGRSASDEKIPGIAALSVGNVGNPPPRGWLKVPLLDVARLESGHTPSRQHSDYWGGDIPWISIPDARLHHGKTIKETDETTNELGLANSSARLLPKGTVCLSRTASVGYVTIMGRPMSTSQDFANWVCSEALLPEFLLHAFLAEGDHLRNFGRGTTHTTIYYPELKALHVLLPSVDEQREIVRRLTKSLALLDSAAAAHTAAVAELDRIDQSILARAFSGGLVEPEATLEDSTIAASASVEAQTYLLRFVPALLRAAGHPVSLDDLNQVVALRFLPTSEILPVIERLGGKAARVHFAASEISYEDGAFLAAMQLLRRAGAIAVSTDRRGIQHLTLGPKPPPSTTDIDADARYLAPLLSRVPASSTAAVYHRLQSVAVGEALLATP